MSFDMDIDIDSIMKSVVAFTKTPEGKALIQDALLDIARGNIDAGASSSGGDVSRGAPLTPELMEEAANKMIHVMATTAGDPGYGLPPSVIRHFEYLESGKPIEFGLDNGGVEFHVNLYFMDDLSRPSLIAVGKHSKGNRTGPGVDDIVSLFNEGYDARKTVYGIWEGHNDDNPIPSLSHRDPLHFIEQAVSDFNGNYGAKYGCEAKVIIDE